MVQAYCRGLLEPGYECGVDSIAREKMILWALAMENIGHAVQEAVSVQTSLFGPHIDISKSGEYIKSTQRRLHYASEKLELSPRTMQEMFDSTSSLQNLVTMYKAAVSSGLVDKFLAEVKASNQYN